MHRHTRIPLALVFLCTFLIVGVPYWSISQHQLALPRDISRIGLVTAGTVAVAVCGVGRGNPWATGLAAAAAVPAAVLARVVVDVSGPQAPTTGRSRSCWRWGRR